MHAEHLEAVHGVGPHTISVPRVKKADDIDPDEFDNGLEDEIFEKKLLKNGDKIILLGYGGGLNTGSILMEV